MEENQNNFDIIRVLSKIKEKGYIEVKDMAIFFNALYETNKTTDEKVNRILTEKEYQVAEDDVTIDTPIIESYIAPTEYIPTTKAIGLYKVKQLGNRKTILVWRADILLEIIGVNNYYNIDLAASNLLLFGATYRLIDYSYKDVYTILNAIKSNLQYLESLFLK